MDLLPHAKRFARVVRRGLGLSPMQAVMRKLQDYGIKLSALNALELFGGDGTGHTKDYAGQVRSLEVWEINPAHEVPLKRSLPSATIKICDSYRELQSASRRYGLIVIDNSPVYRPHIEHFDLFGSAVNAAANKVVMIINVIPDVNQALLRQYPGMADADVIARRSSFYGVADGMSIPLEKIVQTYETLLKKSGFVLQQWFIQRRNAMVCYLALIAHRTGSASNGEHSAGIAPL